MKTIYFDNAATSWPKPETVMEAMKNFSALTGANPGRSGHRLSVEAGRTMLDARIAAAELFNTDDPLSIVFTKNATEAINIALAGLLKPGDHVITSSMEHNSVMRTLRHLEKNGVQLSVVKCSGDGELDPSDIVPLIKTNTKLIAVTHASNVTGSIMPIAEIGTTARQNGIVLFVDAAQSAGALPIDVKEMNIDLLAFSGHKSLFGPQGTGGLYIRKGLEGKINPLMTGGTGSRSEFEEQPGFMPDKFECGTPNTIGIAGLGAGLKFVLDTKIENIKNKERLLVKKLADGLKSIHGITLYGFADLSKMIPVISFNIKGMVSSDISSELDEKYNIMSRAGLQCAPSAHRTIGTFPGGTVRLSPGYFNTDDEIDSALKAIEAISMKRKI